MYKVTWRNQALHELENIVDYTRSQWGDYQVVFLLGIFKETSHILSELPQIGRPLRRKNAYALVISKAPFIIFYELSGNEVFINQIIHMSKRH